MVAYNALNYFKSEYKLQQCMQMLTDTLAAIQTHDGQPLIPNQEGTPLNALIRQLNLQPAAPAPAYDFELDHHVTVDEIQNPCNIRNICIFDVTRRLGRHGQHGRYGPVAFWRWSCRLLAMVLSPFGDGPNSFWQGSCRVFAFSCCVFARDQ